MSAGGTNRFHLPVPTQTSKCVTSVTQVFASSGNDIDLPRNRITITSVEAYIKGGNKSIPS